MSFNFRGAVTICSDFGAQEMKVCHCFHCFHIYLTWVMGPDAMILVFWMLSFKSTFSLSSFTFIKRLLSSSLLSAIRVEETQAGIKIAGRNIINLRYADKHNNSRKWRGNKEPLDEGERGEWKSWLKTRHSKKWRSWYPVLSLPGKYIWRKWKQSQISFSWAPKSLQTATATMKLKDVCSLEES